uniref:CD86 molecule n=1 Tax=Myotis myotis TaxID=51298 RepID=A0A7J7ZTR4_MYOMY|nr:CD86 molecule [Myotis myotis]
MPRFCVPWECLWAYTSGLWELRWMGICDSTMGLSTTLFVMALLLSGAASMKSQAYFNKTGDLPCYFTNPQNISLDELVVFWQDQDKLVLYELLKGKENPQSVDANYKDRTSLDQDNWTLRLHNIEIKDKGLYQCFIYHRKSLQGMIIHQNDIDLSVLDAKPPQPPLPVPDNVLLTALPVLLFGVCGMVVFFITLKKRKKKPGPSHECEVIRVEEEESEQAKERVENRVPERSDEAQCILNISKTDSDLGAVMQSKEISSGIREEKHECGTQEPF